MKIRNILKAIVRRDAILIFHKVPNDGDTITVGGIRAVFTRSDVDGR